MLYGFHLLLDNVLKVFHCHWWDFDFILLFELENVCIVHFTEAVKVIVKLYTFSSITAKVLRVRSKSLESVYTMGHTNRSIQAG